MANARSATINLELTQQEARVLLYICNNIGGGPVNTARRITDEIGAALINAGVHAPNSGSVNYHKGGFCFLRDSVKL